MLNLEFVKGKNSKENQIELIDSLRVCYTEFDLQSIVFKLKYKSIIEKLFTMMEYYT